MRILFIIPWFNLKMRTGNSRRILHLIKYLRLSGIDIYVLEITPYSKYSNVLKLLFNIDGDDVKPTVDIHVHDYVLSGKSKIQNYTIRLWLMALLFFKFIRLRKTLLRVDLVHVPDSAVEWVLFGYFVSKLIGQNLVITFQLVPRYLKEFTYYGNYGLFRSLLHNYLNIKRYGLIRAIAYSLIVWIYVNVIKRAHAIALNRYDYDLLREKFNVNAYLSWNGISKPAIMEGFDRKRVIYIGRDERKGLMDILKLIPMVLSERQDVNFVLIGPGNVKFRNTRAFGVVSEFDKWRLMCSSGIFILPSYHDSFSITLAEALSCGLPSIIYDIPELRSIYGNCDAIITTKRGDLQSLKDTLFKLLNLSDEEYSELRRKAVGCVDRFNWVNVAKRELEIYREILTKYA